MNNVDDYVLDVDECEVYDIKCHSYYVCVNTIGSYYCGCMRGYVDSHTGCVRM